MSTRDQFTRLEEVVREVRVPSRARHTIDGEASETEFDQLYGILSNQRRRFALHYLKQHEDGVVSLGELTEQVAAWEIGCAPEELTSSQRKRVYTALQQSHLPALTKSSVIEYDESENLVETTELLASIECYPNRNRSTGADEIHHYIGVAALFGVIVSVARLGLWPVSAVPDLVWVTVALLSISVLTYVQLRRERGDGTNFIEPPPEVED